MQQDPYIDHPHQVPIELDALVPNPLPTTGPVPLGGLRLLWREKVAVGRFLRVRLPTVGPDAWADMLVSWHRLSQDGYELGLRFLDPEQAFKMRLMEQVCHIDCYREQVWHREGRRLDAEQAAREWIGRHAHHFPLVIP